MWGDLRWVQILTILLGMCFISLYVTCIHMCNNSMCTQQYLELRPVRSRLVLHTQVQQYTKSCTICMYATAILAYFLQSSTAVWPVDTRYICKMRQFYLVGL